MSQTFQYLIDSSGVVWQISVNTDGSIQQTTIGSLPSGSTSQATKTVTDVINAVSQDVRQVLGTTGTDQSILIDYTNRVSQKLLRQSNWNFALSTPQRFMTRIGVNDYWLGTSGAAPTGAFDTGLNLSDIRTIKPETVYDRSNYTVTGKYEDAPLTLSFANRDNISVLGTPKAFKNTNDNPYLLSLYPAPDNQNSYQPIPEPPLCLTASGGALAARTYFVKITITDSAGGESATSLKETKIFVPANSLLVVKSPAFSFTTVDSGIQYTGFKVYASTVSNGEVQQNGGTAIVLGSDYTEPVGGISTSTANPPGASTIAPMGGYLIEFRYYKKRTQLQSAGQTLQVPDDFFDVVVAGVNAFAYQYLKKYDESASWRQSFQEGVREMVRDKQMFPEATSDFIHPDSASVSRNLPFSSRF